MRVGLVAGLGAVCFCASARIASAGTSFVESLLTPLVVTKAGNGAIGLATGDFNRDNKLDLAVTYVDDLGGGQQGFVAVMLGNGDQTLQAPVILATLPPNVSAGGVLAKDFDVDDKLDLVVELSAARQILFFKGHGDSTCRSVAFCMTMVMTLS